MNCWKFLELIKYWKNRFRDLFDFHQDFRHYWNELFIHFLLNHFLRPIDNFK